MTASYPLIYKEPPIVRLVICYNPFMTNDLATHQLWFDQHKTLADYLNGLPSEVEWNIAYNGEPVESDQWALIKPVPDSIITIVRVPEGGDTGKNILRLVAVLALVALTAGFAGALTPGFLITAIGAHAALAVTASAIAMAGGAVINALLPAQQINPSSAPVSSSYSIQGPKNTAKEGVPVPIVYGTYRVGGNIVDLYTRNIGDDQYLFMRTVLNDGQVSDINTVWLNNNDIYNFKDVEYRVNLGAAGETPCSWFNSATRLFNVQTKIDQTGVLYTTSSDVDRVRVDVSFPLGLISNIVKSGNKYPQLVNLSIDYRPLTEDGTTPTADWAPLTLEAEVPLDTSGSSGIYTVTQTRSAYFTVIPTAPTSGTEWSVTAQYKKSTDSTWTTYGVRTGDYQSVYDYRGGYNHTGGLPSIGWTLNFPGLNDWEVQFIGGAIQDNTISNPNLNGKTQDNLPGIANNLAVTRQTSTPFNLTYQSATLTRGRYQIRVKRATAEQTDLNKPDQCWVTDFGEIDNDNVQYSSLAMLSMKIKLTDQLGSVPQISAIVAGTIVKYYDDDGNVTGSGYSNNPADILLDMLLDPLKGNGDPSKIIFSKFGEWRDYCSANGLVFNGVFDFVTTLWDAMQSVARVGRAVLLPQGTRYTVVIDQAADPVMLFNGSNMYRDTFQKSWVNLSDRANEIQQTFYDHNDKYIQKLIRLPNLTVQSQQGSIKPATVSGFGITSIEQATREAEYQARHNSYSTNSITFDAPIEAIGLSIGDVALIQHDSVKYAEGVGGRLETGSTASVIHLDRPVTMTAGNSYSLLITTDALQLYTIAITGINGNKVIVTGLPSSGLPRMRRLVQGSIDREIVRYVALDSSTYSVTLDSTSGVSTGAATVWDTDVIVERPVAYVAGDSTSVTLTTPLSGAPKIYSPFLFGQVTTVKQPYRLNAISGDDDLFRRTLSFVNYDSRIYGTGSWGVPTLSQNSTQVIGQVTQLHATWNSNPLPSQTVIDLTIDWKRPDGTATYGGADIYYQNLTGNWVTAGSVSNVTSFQTTRNTGDTLTYKVVAYDDSGNRASFDNAPTIIVRLDANYQSSAVPTNLAYTIVSQDVKNSALVTWTAPTTTTPSGYELAIKTLSTADFNAFVSADGVETAYPTSVTTDTDYVIVAKTSDVSTLISNLAVNTFSLRIRSVQNGSTSDWVYLPFDITPAGLQAYVTNLTLNAGTPGASTASFGGRDANWTWDDILTQASTLTAIQQAGLPYYWQDYRIRILDATTSAVIRTEYTSTPAYSYTYDKNVADGSSSGPRRTFKIEVTARGNQGQLSTAVLMTASNPIPSLGSVTVTPGIDHITFEYVPPTDPDFVGIELWLYTTSGITVNDSNVTFKGPGSVTLQAISQTSYFYRYAFYDAFGTTGITLSSEASVTTLAVQTSDLSTAVQNSLNAGKTISDTLTAAAAAQSKTIAAYLNGITSAGTAVNVPLDQIFGQQQSLAQTVIAQALAAKNSIDNLNAVAYVNGQPVGSVVQTLNSVSNVLVQNMGLIGVRSLDGNSFILDDSKVQLKSDGTALATRIQTIQSTVASNYATITTNYATSASVSGSIAAAQTAITTAYGSAIQSAIYTTALSSSGAAGSLASVITGLQTQFDGLSSTVTSNYSTLSNANSSTASALTSLTSSYNGTAATVTSQASTIATVTGQLYSTYTLIANANGNIAGVRLLAGSGAGTDLSAVLFEANKFQITSGSIATAFQPFTYDAGTGTLYLNQVVATSATIKDLAVTTGKIANLAVDTLQINGSAVSTAKIGASAVTTGSGATSGGGFTLSAGSNTSLVSDTFTLDSTSPGQVQGTFTCFVNPIFAGSISGQQTWVTFNIYRDATLLVSQIAGVAFNIGGSSSLMPGGVVSIAFLDQSPTGGSHSYTAYASISASVPTTVGLGIATLNVLEVKR